MPCSVSVLLLLDEPYRGGLSAGDGLTRAGNGGTFIAMPALIFWLVVIGLYAFIGTAPKEAVQLMLFLFWGLLGLLAVGGIVYELIRAL